MATALTPSRPAKIICVDIVPKRLEMAKQYGATHTINSKEHPDLVKALHEVTDGEGLDAAIDTTGRPEVLRSLLDSCGKKGMVISVGVGSVSLPIQLFLWHCENLLTRNLYCQLSAEVSTNIFKTVNSGRMYVGCAMGNCYPQQFIPMLIESWQAGRFPFDELIQKYRADDCQIAVADVLSGKTVKAVLLWNELPCHEKSVLQTKT